MGHINKIKKSSIIYRSQCTEKLVLLKYSVMDITSYLYTYHVNYEPA